MKAVLLGSLWFLVAADVSAHRLDEYLQATRISVATNRVDLSIELTAGVAVAGHLLTLIDLDRDGRISADEGKAYAQRFLNDLQLRLDAESVALKLGDHSFPPLESMKAGVGVIRINAAAAIERLQAGPHTLSLTNAHLPDISAHLVNAVVPKDRAITITRQRRNESQAGYELRFGVAPQVR
jgi:hypothetical protein